MKNLAPPCQSQLPGQSSEITPTRYSDQWFSLSLVFMQMIHYLYVKHVVINREKTVYFKHRHKLGSLFNNQDAKLVKIEPQMYMFMYFLNVQLRTCVNF